MTSNIQATNVLIQNRKRAFKEEQYRLVLSETQMWLTSRQTPNRLKTHSEEGQRKANTGF